MGFEREAQCFANLLSRKVARHTAKRLDALARKASGDIPTPAREDGREYNQSFVLRLAPRYELDLR
eukprot:4030860-Prymnesium_polylepis.1